MNKMVPGRGLNPTVGYLHWGPAPGDVLSLWLTETTRWPATTIHNTLKAAF